MNNVINQQINTKGLIVIWKHLAVKLNRFFSNCPL